MKTPDRPKFRVIVEDNEKDFKRELDKLTSDGYYIHSENKRYKHFSALLWRENETGKGKTLLHKLAERRTKLRAKGENNKS